MKRIISRFNEDMAVALCESVHGSGLDTDPTIVLSRRFITIHWDFHLMNDTGYYVGYWRFKVVIPRVEPEDFKLYGKRGNPRGQEAAGIKDYLSDVFYYAITELLKQGE